MDFNDRNCFIETVVLLQQYNPHSQKCALIMINVGLHESKFIDYGLKPHLMYFRYDALCAPYQS